MPDVFLPKKCAEELLAVTMMPYFLAFIALPFVRLESPGSMATVYSEGSTRLPARLSTVTSSGESVCALALYCLVLAEMVHWAKSPLSMP